MIRIAHRGNLRGPIPNQENTPYYVDAALAAGFHAEIDVWHNGVERDAWWLGHDYPWYAVPIEWLIDRQEHLWIHCKNFAALSRLADLERVFNAFWHEHDAYTVTTRGFIWANTGQSVGPRTVIVDLPGQTPYHGAYGVCTDYPLLSPCEPPSASLV